MEKLGFDRLQHEYLTKISFYLQKFVDSLYPEPYREIRDIFSYHLGLKDPIEKQGKRIRPLLTLICASGCGISADDGLPAAVAVELIHNFSLIHDDIEDNGESRRGKSAVWKKWGLAQGLNAGDAMFNGAFLALQDLRDKFDDHVFANAGELLLQTCDDLTKGQYLDISFENQTEISTEMYFEMISGKTASLIACATEMGALLADLEADQRKRFRDFGYSIGVAFQIYDDWLGIWGNESITGKSTSSDLSERKKTFPILLGMQTSEFFLTQLKNTELSQRDIADLAEHLSKIGIEERVQKECADWSNRALIALGEMHCARPQKELLEAITNNLLMRER